MESLDATIIQTAAPAIARDFGVQPADVNTAMVAYLVAAGIAIPASAWLAARLGDRVVFLAAIVLFTVASIACASVESLALLIAARAVQGIGGALMIPVGRLAVLREIRPADVLDAVAFLTWPALLAPVIAPAIGGILSDTVGWRWIFLINAPIGILLLALGLLLVPRTVRQPDARLDGEGFALMAVALVAITSGAELLSGGSGPAIAASLALIALGVIAGWVAITRMRRRARPLLDWGMLRIPSFRAASISGGVYRLVITGAPFVFTLLFQVGFGWSATRAGLMVMLVFLGNVLIKPATSPLLRRFGFRTVLIAANLLGALTLATFVLVRADTPLFVVGLLLVCSGSLRSIGFSAYNTLPFLDVKGEDPRSVNTLVATLQQVAIALGIATGALLVRFGTAASGAVTGDEALGYSWAPGLAALLLVLPLGGAIRLPRDTGSGATRRRVSATHSPPQNP
ncbi:MFS transporter [Microbacterium rhizomatis]|uniref:MFS transporter n=2 Tax=Microbacterium rhizomatis TaxID=1631477 RepID=A0A5J5IWM0_9MICO|nr:MFS transporter [Microbacterium rhizomatis]